MINQHESSKRPKYYALFLFACNACLVFQVTGLYFWPTLDSTKTSSSTMETWISGKNRRHPGKIIHSKVNTSSTWLLQPFLERSSLLSRLAEVAEMAWNQQIISFVETRFHGFWSIALPATIISYIFFFGIGGFLHVSHAFCSFSKIKNKGFHQHLTA